MKKPDNFKISGNYPGRKKTFEYKQISKYSKILRQVLPGQSKLKLMIEST
jgi:hypothetical protein